MNTNQNQTRSWPLRAAALLLACALCACLGLRVAAQTGSITVTMRTNPADPASTPVPGGTLTAYLVAELTEKEQTADAESGLEYVLTENFAGLNEAENGITLPIPQQAESLNDAADLATQLAAYVQAQGIQGTTVTVDENGVAAFNELENGLYLLVQNTAPDGYQTLQPFLVEVPTMQENGPLYDLQAYPKLAVISDTSSDPSVPWWLPLLGLVGLPFIGGGNTDTDSGTVTQTPAEAEVTPPPAEAEVPTPEETGEGSVAEEAANAKLPQTGQLNWPVPVLTLAGLTLVLLGFALRRSGKEEQ
jgi:hypothetical protein